MELVGYGLILPYSVLWIFLIWWLIKPNYFPFYNKDKLPSRLSVLWITVVIYIAMTAAIMLSVDLNNTAKNIASDAEMLAFFISLVLVVLLVVWSYRTGKNRNNLSYNSIESTSKKPAIKSQPIPLKEEPLASPPPVIPDNGFSEDLTEEYPDVKELDFDDNGDLKTSFEPEPWRNKHSDADFQIGVYTKDADLKLYYCKVDDLYQNKKGDWIVEVIDTKNYTDKTFNIYKIDDLEDKWGARYLLYEDMVQAFADELGIEVDVWGEDEELEIEPQEQPAIVVETSKPKPQKKSRKRVAKEDPSHSMVYVDSKGNLSEREINIRNVEAKDGKLYVKAYCFKRKRLRTFIAKNIVSLYDLTTKETFTDEDEVYNELLSWVLESES